MTVQQALIGAWGYIPGNTTNAPSFFGQQSLNSTANWSAFAFIPQAATSLSAFRFFMTTKTGTGGTINCKVYGDSNGSPNITGGVVDTLTVGTLTASSFINCTGGSVALTAGNQYWVVISNSDAAPASNNITVFNAGAGAFPFYSACDMATSSNTGTSWTLFRNSGGARFDYGDGTFWGTPITSTSGTGFQTDGVYSTHEVGVQFTTPANVELNTTGAAMYWQPSGSPTGGVFFKLYDSTHTLLAQTYSLANGESKTQQVWKHRLWVPSTDSVGANGILTLSASTTYTLTMAETTQTDTSSNLFRPYGVTWDSDANSTPLIPWSMQLDAFNGTTWTQTANKFCPFALKLATGNEFTSSGGGGGGTTGYAFVG